ncbi:MAG: lytic transglycosylase domain-containing protein [Bdellovibrionales bacterium]|nr:lytic transglycosylase domain-containing protein [Bdellovibrionales bacterium]
MRILRLELPNHSDAELHELARLVLQLSDRYKFSPILVLSLIKVESGFDRLAVSNQGAMGLMQIKPSTAMEVAGRIRVSLAAEHELYEPAVNMLLSLHYLKELREQFREPHLYLAAYNVGPGTVQKIIRSDSPVPAGYYQKVRRSYNQYARALLAQGT